MKHSARLALPLGLSLLLAGCAHWQTGWAAQPVPLEDVIRQLKRDIGEYNAYSAAHANDPRLGTVCGGKVNLKITTATVTVTTSAKIDSGFTAGAEVAPLAFLSKAGLSAAAGRGRKNSETLSFKLAPAADGPMLTAQAGTPPVAPGNLYRVLTNLRESLLKASDTAPCLRFADKQDNSVEFGFVASQNEKLGGGVNLLIFSLGASRSSELTAANTVKIAFEGDGDPVFQVE